MFIFLIRFHEEKMTYIITESEGRQQFDQILFKCIVVCSEVINQVRPKCFLLLGWLDVEQPSAVYQGVLPRMPMTGIEIFFLSSNRLFSERGL